MVAILIALLISFVVVSFILFRYWWREESKKIESQERLKRGIYKEQEAKSLLKSLGYRILDEQLEFHHEIFVDGKAIYPSIKIDYLVKKGGRTYIIEVKSGKTATSLFHPPTRRQILEYSIVIPNDGIFLLDMEEKKLHLVEFAAKKQNSQGRIFFVGIFIGILISALIYYYVLNV